MKIFDSKRIFLYLIITLYVISGDLYSQASSFGNTYIFNNGEIGIINIQHNFLNGGSGIQPGTVGTDRTAKQGFMSFVGTASWTGASDDAFVDGYVKTYMTSPFIFPIGDNSKYRPAAISTATLANPADASYYGVSATTAITSKLNGGNETVLPASGPFNTALKGVGVGSVDDLEYWDINGATPARITLTWDVNSAITSLTSLSILGWNGTQWVAIASTVDGTSILGGSSSLNSGSISTNTTLVPNTYEVYTLGILCNAGSSAPTLSSNTIKNTCPSTTVNLNSLVTSTTPSGASLVWFANNTHTGTAYATPTTAISGTYYPFYYDSVNNCYSPVGPVVTVTITVPPAIPTVASTTQPTCTVTTGTIVFTAQTGVEYSINNGTSYQASATFAGLAAGTYTLRVRSTTDSTCSTQAAATVTINAVLSADNDSDGVPDVCDLDDDNDGILDTVESVTSCTNNADITTISLDCDGDGIPNAFDLDSDNDGINDVNEAEGIDADGNGQADGTVSSSGIPASAGTGLAPPNTDGTGGSNPYDVDSDNDSISDLIEGGLNSTTLDPNDDGVVDCTVNCDPDEDGILTPVDVFPTIYGDSILPDLTPSVDIDSLEFFSSGVERDFVVNVFEINDVKSIPDVPIEFRVAKASALNITYSTSSGVSNVYGGINNSNDDWIFTENTGYIIVRAKTGVTIPQNGSKVIGFKATRKAQIPSNTSQSITVSIIYGSAGEEKIDNNIVDTKIIVN